MLFFFRQMQNFQIDANTNGSYILKALRTIWKHRPQLKIRHMFTTNLAKTSTIYAREDQVIRIFVDIS